MGGWLRLGCGDIIARFCASSPWEELPFTGSIERESGARRNRSISMDTAPNLYGIFDQLCGGRAVIRQCSFDSSASDNVCDIGGDKDGARGKSYGRAFWAKVH